MYLKLHALAKLHRYTHRVLATILMPEPYPEVIKNNFVNYWTCFLCFFPLLPVRLGLGPCFWAIFKSSRSLFRRTGGLFGLHDLQRHLVPTSWYPSFVYRTVMLSPHLMSSMVTMVIACEPSIGKNCKYGLHQLYYHLHVNQGISPGSWAYNHGWQIELDLVSI